MAATVESTKQGLHIHLQVSQMVGLDPVLRSIQQGVMRLGLIQIHHVRISVYGVGESTVRFYRDLHLPSSDVDPDRDRSPVVEFPPLPAQKQDVAEVEFPPLPISTAVRHRLRPDQILRDRYRLEQQLANSGIRKTWLATDLMGTDEKVSPVVIKLLAFGGDMRWTDFTLFEREAQILNHLHHAQIPAYRDYFSIQGTQTWFGIVQEYVPGLSLKELLQQQQRLTEDQVLQIAFDVLDVLIYLHGLSPPVLHRDIKPSNLIWGEDKRVHVVDFGSVQDQGSSEGRTFTVVGTYGYAPIEQFGGRAVPASDLYGLGATLIHLLTGSSPADLPQQELRIRFADRVSATPALIHWMEKLVEPAPENRFATARQALASLRSTLGAPSQLAPVSPLLKPVLQSNEFAALATSTHNPDQLLNTFSTPYLVPQQQPYGSQVRVQASDHQMHIHIPPDPLPSLGLKLGLYTLGITFPLWLTGGALGLGIITILAPLIGIGLSLVVLRHHLTDTEVQLDRRHFTISRTILGVYQRQQGPTAPILDVFQETIVVPGGDTGVQPRGYQITIQVGVIGYSFGRSLSRVECLWLAQTIKQWLKLE